MSKDRKHSQHRSKGERLNWSPLSREGGKVLTRDAMSGRFLTSAQVRETDSRVVRQGVKRLVP